VLRLEKQHVIVGQDTDSESNLLAAGLEWLPKLDKDDFVGKWALEHASVRERLVGFVSDVLPLEGGQVVRDGRPVGRVTSARRSELVGSVVGLAWVPPELAVEDAELQLQVDGAPHPARVRLQPFHDPAGERVRA
jgi:glycine cleavage system aminomethyltransferase T